MALDVLLEAIALDGDVEARQLVDAARAQADEMRRAADARAERRCTEALASRDAAIRIELDVRRARTLRDARAEVLSSRAQFLDRIFAAVEQALPGVLDDPSLAESVERLCREALDCFPDGEVRIRCRPGLADEVRRHSSGQVDVVADNTVPEGVVVEALDGSSRVDNTLLARLRRLRPRLSIVLLKALEPT